MFECLNDIQFLLFERRIQKTMIFQLFGIVMLTATFAVATDVPLKTIYTVVPGFPEAQICNRIFNTNYWMAPGNVRTVQFKGTLETNEDPIALCDCVHYYIGQMGSNWLDGVDVQCYVNVNSNEFVLVLTGDKDPTYNANETDVTLDRPCEKLKRIFDELEVFDVAQLRCDQGCFEDNCGCIHCNLKCPLNGDVRPIERICQEIEEYCNQKGWLEDSLYYCNKTGDNVEVLFFGNSDPAYTCNLE